MMTPRCESPSAVVRIGGRLALLALSSVGAGAPVHAQWRSTDSHSHASFRGLSVAPDGTIWVGGTAGTVLRSTDSGATWRTDTVPGAHSFDFRGVAGIDAQQAYVMVASADTARIYQTTDGGASWALQYRDQRPGVFLDGIGCWSARRCLAAGDPIAGRFVVITTTDGGAHWSPLAPAVSPVALPGEAAFAASNSSVVTGPNGQAWLATGGGSVARVWRSSDYGATWTAAATPITAGIASAGIFSLAFCDGQHGVAVGGDYAKPAAAGAHVAVTADGGITWTAADTAHHTPYLSSAACVTPNGQRIVGVGPTGMATSADGGMTWTSVSQKGFNAVAVARGGIVAVGADGSTGQSIGGTP
jgi:photosystem II stability/assembly factor-like uncharacterized protein